MNYFHSIDKQNTNYSKKIAILDKNIGKLISVSKKDKMILKK